MVEFRIEIDSLGEVKVPKDKYWGAQTQRSLNNFPFTSLGQIKFSTEFIRALGIIKRACAEVNRDLGLLKTEHAELIVKASQEVIDGKFNDEFPLVIWQTGSGTQTNMNMNEVISNRAIELSGGKIGTKVPIHPNNHINLSQSSNDVIPTAMHISAVEQIKEKLLPSLTHLKATLEEKEKEFRDIIKTGRTHLMDATPVTLGQEFSGYATQIVNSISRIKNSLSHLYELALGGTAVGTGLNSHPEFAERVAKRIAELTNYPFRTGRNKFEGIAAHDAIVETSGALKVLAVSLMKIANDIRWLGSGPRAGLGELLLPVNEPGSSIMPGKVNPTQPESVTQVVTQVLGNDVTIGFAGSQGNFELNVFKPVMIHNLLQSIQLLADVSRNFADRCIKDLKPNKARILENLEKNLMLITRLSPVIGYEAASEVAHEAYKTGKTLKEIILEKGIMKNEEEINKALDPSRMISPGFQ
ncbi:MAG: class II fumarate hydratase [Candidatus Heimdallarchaeota archaeon]|nr:MAG: class II fumarate hydratase [Candidatus Heimdallarchaeota archaeon]